MKIIDKAYGIILICFSVALTILMLTGINKMQERNEWYDYLHYETHKNGPTQFELWKQAKKDSLNQ